MAENQNKSQKTAKSVTESYSVTLVSVLSDTEQIEAAKQKAAAFSGVNPEKLTPIGKPSSTKDGLRVEFGVK